MASVRAALLLLLPPVSVVVAMAAQLLCRVTARKLSALARSQLACLPSGSGGASSFRYLRQVSSDEEELPVALYCRRRSDKDPDPCVFCLSCIEEDEEVRELRCRHLFHRACLDRWLRARPLQATCPLCRRRLLLGEEEEEVVEEEDGEDMMLLFMACVHSRSSWLWPS